MTVTLEIPPEMEVILKAKAELHGQTLTDYFLTLAELEKYTELSLSEEQIDIVREQIAHRIAGGKGISLKDFHAEMIAKIERRKQRQLAEAAA